MSDTYLVDTHVLLWYTKGDRRLSASVIDQIQDEGNATFVSKASLWEITIKSSLGKLELGASFADFAQLVIDKGFFVLDFDIAVLNVLHTLPYHHHDPFDRLIIAQAIANRLPVISDDKKFSLYSINLIPA